MINCDKSLNSPLKPCFENCFFLMNFKIFSNEIIVEGAGIFSRNLPCSSRGKYNVHSVNSKHYIKNEFSTGYYGCQKQ